MRQFNLFCTLALAALSTLAFGMGDARAESVKQVFEKYGLIGTWAWNCSKRPDGRNNWVFVNRVVNDNTVQRDYMRTATERGWFAMLTQATPIGPTEVRVAGTRDGKPIDGIWRVERNRMTQWEATQDGKKIVESGRLVGGNGRTLPWLIKCRPAGQRGAAPANTRAASATPVVTRGIAPGHVVTAQSGQRTLITTHMSYNGQCKPYHVVIDILSNPTHGLVMTEAKDLVVPAQTPRAGKQPAQCVGRTVPGVAIVYQSRPGFVGQDSFAYRRSTPDRPDDRAAGDISYTIAVQ